MKAELSNQLATEPKEFKLYSILAGLFAAILVLSATTSAKIFAIGPLTLPGGTILFPIAFIFNDILTETYGYARSRRVIWTGLACEALAAVVYLIVGALPPAGFWTHQGAYDQILGVAPRIALGGMTAYFCGEFANSFVLSKMKYWHHGRRGLKQGWRFVASTMVGEAVDSVVFMTIGFLGTMPPWSLIQTAITLYIVKVLYEIVALPISTRFANWVKKIEGVDHIDTPQDTNYNPFAISSS